MTDASRKVGKRQIADFDSASAMVRATAAYLHASDLPMIGIMPRAMQTAARLYVAAVNSVPERLREQVYIWSGWGEALPARKADEIDVDSIAQWIVDEYPGTAASPA